MKGGGDIVNWDAVGAVAEAIGGIGVILTLAYLSIQIRGSNRVASGQARQSMSEFAMGISKFRAEHADRYAKLASGVDLSPGDKEFQYWSHMQMLSFGEAYFHQFELRLMADSHWQGFSNWMEKYVESPGFEEFWAREGASFSAEYCEWVNEKRENRQSRVTPQT